MDRLFKSILAACGALMIGLLLAMFVTLVMHSWPSIKEFGWHFVTQSVWDPMANEYGAKAFVVGTLLTAGSALLISTPFSLALALFLGEYSTTGLISDFFKSMINLLAGIPSVIYGFWGLFVLVPLVRKFQIWAGMLPYGIGIGTASFILAIMIIPYATAIGRDVIAMVPNDLKEGAYSLGATRMEVLLTVVIPYTQSGLVAGLLLAFGRAIGETMAVTMVIGNMNAIPNSFFAPGNTMASVIANEFSEATHMIHTASLIELGLYLFIISAIFNLLGKWVIHSMEIKNS